MRIAAHAFRDGQPHCALLLSPDHAVFVEDVLIPVKYLMNGTTIRQLAVDSVVYYHIELARHDVVLAQGLPVESYLDTGDRMNFGNTASVIRLHPEFGAGRDIVALWEAAGCAPLVVSGPTLQRARDLVRSRASRSHGRRVAGSGGHKAAALAPDGASSGSVRRR